MKNCSGKAVRWEAGLSNSRGEQYSIGTHFSDTDYHLGLLQFDYSRYSLLNTTTCRLVLTKKTNFNMKVYYRMNLSVANNQNYHCRLKLRFERRQRKTTNILGPSVTRTRFEQSTFQIQVTDCVKKLGLQRVNISNNDDSMGIY